MHRKARSLLSPESRNKLYLLIGCSLEGLYISKIGTPGMSHNSLYNIGLIVMIKSGESEIVVSSNAILCGDIEVPNLCISNKDNFNDEYEFLTDLETINDALNISWIPENINSISLLKDNICWVDGKTIRKLEIDIGVKLILESQELLILARDSSIGIFELWLGNDLKWLSRNKHKLADNYMFDTEQLISIDRFEENISH